MSGLKKEKTTRRIDSETYEDRLKDIFTRTYYDWQIPCENIPLRGSLLWKSEAEEPDPWERLVISVISLAVKDYVYAYRIGNERELERIRNWMTANDLDWVMDCLSRKIESAEHRWHGIEFLEHQIRVIW